MYQRDEYGHRMHCHTDYFREGKETGFDTRHQLLYDRSWGLSYDFDHHG